MLPPSWSPLVEISPALPVSLSCSHHLIRCAPARHRGACLSIAPTLFRSRGARLRHNLFADASWTSIGNPSMSKHLSWVTGSYYCEWVCTFLPGAPITGFIEACSALFHRMLPLLALEFSDSSSHEVSSSHIVLGSVPCYCSAFRHRSSPQPPAQLPQTEVVV
jgi:hypothetical protein